MTQRLLTSMNLHLCSWSTLIAFVLSLVLGFACKKDEEPCVTCPPPYSHHIFLDTLLVNPTEVWMRLLSNDSTSLGKIQVFRDSSSILSENIVSAETTLVDSPLLPSTVHSYRSYRLKGSERIDSTGLIMLRMMDTTSHDFIFQIDTLGDGSSSSFSDVAIINDTCIWAVGAVYLKDSTGNIDPQPYNVAKWNGTRWELQRATVTYLGNKINVPLEGIFAFSQTDIWLMGGFPIHGNGTSWTLYQLQDMGLSVDVSKAWGTSSSNIYFVGLNGSIAHYDGNTWIKIESGTSLQVQDVWGVAGATSADLKLFAVASSKYSNQAKKVLQIQGVNATAFPDSGLFLSLSGIWFPKKGVKYIVGDGVFEQKELSQNLNWRRSTQGIPQNYTEAIRGIDINDIVAVGDFGEISHYNGLSWRSYLAQTSLPTGSYWGVSIRGNVLCAVGFVGNRAIVLVGKR